MLTEWQIRDRINYIGGSDAATVCGLNPYMTPYELWEVKTRRKIAEDISEKPSVKAGNMLEPAVRQWLAQETGLKIELSDDTYVHPDYDFMAANIDGYTLDLTGEVDSIVEIKTTSSDKDWGETGTQQIPDAYRLQVAHYMSVLGAPVAYVGVLIRGVDFRHYRFDRDLNLEGILIAKELEFWRCVKTDTAPPFESRDDFMKRFPKPVMGSSAGATPDIENLIQSIKYSQECIKQNQEQIEIDRAKICEYMGNHENLVGTNGKIIATWKRDKDSVRIDTNAIKANPELFERYSKTYPGPRKFIIK